MDAKNRGVQEEEQQEQRQECVFYSETIFTSFINETLVLKWFFIGLEMDKCLTNFYKCLPFIAPTDSLVLGNCSSPNLKVTKLCAIIRN